MIARSDLCLAVSECLAGRHGAVVTAQAHGAEERGIEGGGEGKGRRRTGLRSKGRDERRQKRGDAELRAAEERGESGRGTGRAAMRRGGQEALAFASRKVKALRALLFPGG